MRASGEGTEFRRLALVMVVFAMAQQAVIPLLPLYEHRFGVPDSSYALLYGVYSLFLIPTLLLAGPLADHRGRKAVLVPAMALLAAASLLFAVAGSMAVLFVGRMLQGLASGAFWAAGGAFARDLSADGGSGRAALMMTATISGATAIGPAAMAIVADRSGNLALPWLLHASGLVVAMLVVGSMRETHAPVPGRAWAMRLELPRSSGRSFIAVMVPAALVFGGAPPALISLIPLMQRQITGSSSPSGTSLVIFLMLTFLTLSQFAARRLLTSRASLVLGGVVCAAALWAVVIAIVINGPALIVASLCLLGIGAGATYWAALTIAMDLSDVTNRAGVVAGFQVIQYAGSVVTSVVVAVVIAVTSLSVTATTLAVVVLAAVPMYALPVITGRLQPGGPVAAMV